MFFDVALTYDPVSRRCDADLGEDGDLVIDETPITPMLLTVGLDRRAAPDDELPIGRSRFLTPHSFSERRGGPCDALDPDGQLAGTRCWLLERAKETEVTRLLYLFWLEEGFQWVETDFGEPAEIDVEWLERERRASPLLAYRIRIEEEELSVSLPVGEAA